MKKQVKELKSLHDEQFKALKRDEMFNIMGGMPINTYWESNSYSGGEAVDCLDGGKDTHNIPDTAPQPPARTYDRLGDGYPMR